jgi:hypothetical protein
VVRNIGHGIKEEEIDPLKDKSLMLVYREHIKQISDQGGKEYAKGTLKRFKSAFNLLEEFMKHRKKDDIKLRDQNYQFITENLFFLKTVRNVEHNTAMGISRSLRRFFISALLRIGYINISS